MILQLIIKMNINWKALKAFQMENNFRIKPNWQWKKELRRNNNNHNNIY